MGRVILLAAPVSGSNSTTISTGALRATMSSIVSDRLSLTGLVNGVGRHVYEVARRYVQSLLEVYAR